MEVDFHNRIPLLQLDGTEGGEEERWDNVALKTVSGGGGGEAVCSVPLMSIYGFIVHTIYSYCTVAANPACGLLNK